MEDLSILIVEDDQATIEKLCQNIRLFNYSIVGITGNAIEAIEIVKKERPNIIILDLELHLGGGTGVEVLENIKPYSKDIFILVTTNNVSKIVYDTVRELGADFILSKHQENYSEAAVISLLNRFSGNIGENKEESLEKLDIPTIRKRLFKDFQNIGFNPKHSGSGYLIDSIIHCIEGDADTAIQMVAHSYNRSKVAIERAMQNAIDWAWTNGDPNDLLKYYKARINPAKGHPTITEFICYFTELYMEKD